MAYSIQTAVSDGTLEVLDLSIKYMDKSHIFVYVDDVLVDGSSYSYVWLTDTRIQVVPAVAKGSTLKVIRKTLTDKMWHEFSKGARFSTTSMDDNFEQLLFLAQEYSEGIYVSDFYTDIDVHLKRILNLGDPIQDGDAVNLKTLKKYLPNADLIPPLVERIAAAAVAASASAAAVAAIPTDLASTASGKGAEMVAFKQAGSGAVATNVQAKLSESVSVKDFGAVGDGVTDDTAAFVAAQNASMFIFIPAGTYVLDNFRPRTGRNFYGSGYENTIIKQKETGNYAINCLSDATVGQLLGVSITNLKMVGATGATVAALNIEANGVYAVTHSRFDYVAKNTYSPLRMNCPTAGAIYNCEIKVTSDVSSVGITSEGTYNRYDYFITNVASGLYLNDISTSCVFHKLVTEGAIQINGQDNEFQFIAVENFIGNAQTTVLRLAGTGHNVHHARFINIPNSKVTNQSGIEVYSGRTSINNVSFFGTYPAGAPYYPMFLAPGTSGSISNFNRGDTNQTLDGYTTGSILRAWTFNGENNLIRAPKTRNGIYVWVNTFATSGETVFFGENSTYNDWYDAFVLNVAGTLATLTITLPQSPVNGQTATITSATGTVTTLTLAPGAGKSVVGAPTGLAAGGSFTLVYRSSNTTWYRVQ